MGAFIPPKREAGFFITKDEKAELVDQGTELTVKTVERRVSTFGKNADGSDQFQYVVVVDLDSEERGLSYNEGVASRDSLLAELKLYLENETDQEPVNIVLERVKSQSGRPVNIITVVGSEDEDPE